MIDELVAVLSGANVDRAAPVRIVRGISFSPFRVSTVRLSRDYSVEACLSRTFALLVVRLVASGLDPSAPFGTELVRDWRIPDGSAPDLRELAEDVLRAWTAHEVMSS